MQYALNYSGTRFLSTENQNYSMSWWILISYPDLTLFYTENPLAVGDLGTRLGGFHLKNMYHKVYLASFG